ncbi:hypothetical protein DS837_25620 [Azospirillum brasilense]|uniref:Uncharacterized protein n=2 Tax=Azospirillum brasilense TaxID=192 RepID=A0A6L3AU55_AZOBR|nr:hypothetical protein DS837_25620 [Azospirillum brasilense]
MDAVKEAASRDGFHPPSDQASRPPDIRATGGGYGEGAVYMRLGTFAGRLKRTTNPFNDASRPWVFDEGLYVLHDGKRYAGRFHYFHKNWGEHSHHQDDWVVALDGTYILAGNRADAQGKTVTGLFKADITPSGVSDFTPADDAYLAWFEGRYQDQVAAFKRAELAERNSGVSFGQVLALGLGAFALSQADIPAVKAVDIGGAFAADVLSGGRTNALSRRTEPPRTASAKPAAGPSASVDGHRQDSVSITCPTGVSASIPLSYKTQACRSAMIDFARAYSCNLIDDFATVTRQCASACGNNQCRE